MTAATVETTTTVHNYVVMTSFETDIDGEPLFLLGVFDNFITISAPPVR